MSFDFASQDEQNLFISLKGLVNKNQGFFKTAKQAQFLFRQYSERFNSYHTREQVTNHWAVPVAADQVTVEATAYTRWADYGSRSVVPVLYVFVVDQLGVVAQYKVGGSGNLRDGWAPDASKTKLLWQRDPAAVAPFTLPTEAEKAAEKAAEPVSQWIGTVGHKVDLTATLIRERDMGYGQFGQMFISVFRDAAGNIINVWKKLNLTVGQTVSIAGTVKAHDQYHDIKQTTLTRVRVA